MLPRHRPRCPDHLVVERRLATPSPPCRTRATHATGGPACSWDRPGRNAIHAATWSPRSTATARSRRRCATRLKAAHAGPPVRRPGRHPPRFDQAASSTLREPAIRDMHFGHDRVCGQVTRAGWTAQMHERGSGLLRIRALHPGAHGCRNVSRIERRLPAMAEAGDNVPCRQRRLGIPPAHRRSAASREPATASQACAAACRRRPRRPRKP